MTDIEHYMCKCKELKSMCIENIERIDRLSDNAVATDVDIGMAYAYRKVLQFIEKGE